MAKPKQWLYVYRVDYVAATQYIFDMIPDLSDSVNGLRYADMTNLPTQPMICEFRTSNSPNSRWVF